MIIKIGIAIVLAILTLMVGNYFWEVIKRGKFLKLVIRDESILSHVIKREILDNPSPKVALFAEKMKMGYFANIGVLIRSDSVTQWRLKLIFSAILLGTIIGSSFLGPIYAAINIGLFLLSAVPGTSRSAQANALDQVMAIAVILHRWNLENAQECAKWIEQASGLRPIYDAVKRSV